MTNGHVYFNHHVCRSSCFPTSNQRVQLYFSLIQYSVRNAYFPILTEKYYQFCTFTSKLLVKWVSMGLPPLPPIPTYFNSVVFLQNPHQLTSITHDLEFQVLELRAMSSPLTLHSLNNVKCTVQIMQCTMYSVQCSVQFMYLWVL